MEEVEGWAGHAGGRLEAGFFKPWAFVFVIRVMQAPCQHPILAPLLTQVEGAGADASKH